MTWRWDNDTHQLFKCEIPAFIDCYHGMITFLFHIKKIFRHGDANSETETWKNIIPTSAVSAAACSKHLMCFVVKKQLCIPRQNVPPLKVALKRNLPQHALNQGCNKHLFSLHYLLTGLFFINSLIIQRIEYQRFSYSILAQVPKAHSLNCLFCTTSSPKFKDI